MLLKGAACDVGEVLRSLRASLVGSEPSWKLGKVGLLDMEASRLVCVQGAATPSSPSGAADDVDVAGTCQTQPKYGCSKVVLPLEWVAAQRWRAEWGLPPRKLHVTLGLRTPYVPCPLLAIAACVWP